MYTDIQKNILFFAAFTGPGGKEAMFSGPNFGLYRMKFYLEHRYPGTKVDVVDPSIIDVDFKKLPYDYIGFSVCHETLQHDIGLIHKARKECPDALLVCGGIHATFIHKWLLEHTPTDFVILGEGEFPMERVLEAYDPAVGTGSLKDIPGVSVRGQEAPRNPNLKSEQFSFVSELMDFGRIPYPIHWKANADQYASPDPQVINTVRLFTGNYCPWNCTFCSSTNFLDYANKGDFELKKTTMVVILSADEIFKMIQKVVASRPETKTIIFDDDNFVMNMVRVTDIAKLVTEAKTRGEIPKDLSFICQARIDNFRSDMAHKALHLMKESGFRMIMYGVESLSESVLTEFYKNMPVQLIDKVLRRTHDCGIQPLFYLILFSPGTTMEDVRNTVTGVPDYLEMGMEVTLNFFVQDLPGTFYDKMRDLPRDYKDIPILVDGEQVSTISKSEFLFPKDEAVKTFAFDIQDQYPEYEDLFKRRFGIKHVPGRVHSFIMFYAILEKLECHAEKERILEIFEAQYATKV